MYFKCILKNRQKLEITNDREIFIFKVSKCKCKCAYSSRTSHALCTDVLGHLLNVEYVDIAYILNVDDLK